MGSLRLLLRRKLASVRSPARRGPILLCVPFVVLAGACSSTISGPSDTSACDNGLAFALLPVPLSAIVSITALGWMGPPVHTIPTDHGGMYITGTGINLVAPAAARITSIGQTRYLISPFRQGQSDYKVTAKLCGSYQLVLGHLVTVVDRIATQIKTSDCRTYSTANETVETCESRADVDVAVGETLGTVGGATAGAFDFGLYDSRQQNFFVNPGRYGAGVRNAICPYDPFPVDQRSQLYARMQDGIIAASGEAPVCGSMSVDVAGSARGVWVLQSNPVSQTGDESSFLVLAPHPMFPESRQTFSVGPSAIADAPFGTHRGGRYPLQSSGRVNRPFRDVHADGLIYCYAYDVPARNLSYFVHLAPGDVLTIEKVTHAAGASPCGGDPATWSFSAAALSFIR